MPLFRAVVAPGSAIRLHVQRTGLAPSLVARYATGSRESSTGSTLASSSSSTSSSSTPSVPAGNATNPAAPATAPLPPTPRLGRLERYAPSLAALSTRTGVPLPFLVLSFLVLHELTAVLPVVGFYYLLHWLGAGAGVVAWLAGIGASSSESGSDAGVTADDMTAMERAVTRADSAGDGWAHTVHEWYDEGAARVEKVGRRYGILGFEKGSKVGDPAAGGGAAGAVADAVGAYVLVKVSGGAGAVCCVSVIHSMGHLSQLLLCGTQADDPGAPARAYRHQRRCCAGLCAVCAQPHPALVLALQTSIERLYLWIEKPMPMPICSM